MATRKNGGISVDMRRSENLLGQTEYNNYVTVSRMFWEHQTYANFARVNQFAIIKSQNL